MSPPHEGLGTLMSPSVVWGPRLCTPHPPRAGMGLPWGWTGRWGCPLSWIIFLVHRNPWGQGCPPKRHRDSPVGLLTRAASHLCHRATMCWRMRMLLPRRKTVKSPGLLSLFFCFQFGVTGGRLSKWQMLRCPQLPSGAALGDPAGTGSGKASVTAEPPMGGMNTGGWGEASGHGDPRDPGTGHRAGDSW